MPNAALSVRLVNALRSSFRSTRDAPKLKDGSSLLPPTHHQRSQLPSALPHSFVRLETLITSKVMDKTIPNVKAPLKLIQRAVLVLQPLDSLLLFSGANGDSNEDPTANSECHSSSRSSSSSHLVTSAFQTKLAQFQASLRSDISPSDALDSLLNVWEAALHFVQVSRDQWKKAHICSRSLAKIEANAETLFALIMSRIEFDELFGPTSGASHDAHHHPTSSHHRDESMALSSKKRRRNPARGNGGGSASARNCTCEFIHRYVVLVHKVLGYCSEKMDRFRLSNDDGTPRSLQTLITTTLATSYLRLPFLRKRLLDSLQLHHKSATGSNRWEIQLSQQTLLALGSRQRFRSPGKSAAVFSWSDQLYRRCDKLRTITTMQDQIPSEWLEELLDNEELFLNFVAQVVMRTQSSSYHSQSLPLPGFERLIERSFAIIRSSFEHQRDTYANPMMVDTIDQKEVGNENARSANNKSTLSNSNVPNPNLHLVKPLCEIMRRNVFLVNEWLLLIFQSTNNMLPHHVALCLDHLSFIMREFPAFFKNEPISGSQQPPNTTSTGSTRGHQVHDQEHADTSMLRFVFRCLLESEHFEILKSAQLFLLRHFAQFSSLLQRHLIDILASQCVRLLLHWNRDVRFCFGHVLLYLTFPGNRIVLCAASDVALLGSDSEYLLDIGLLHAPRNGNWDAFDKPICQIIARSKELNRKHKKKLQQNTQKRLAIALEQNPIRKWTMTFAPVRSSPAFSACAQELGESKKERRRVLKHPLGSPCVGRDLMDRALEEYKCLVQTYFLMAKQCSLHESVPVPSFEIKNAHAG